VRSQLTANDCYFVDDLLDYVRRPQTACIHHIIIIIIIIIDKTASSATTYYTLVSDSITRDLLHNMLLHVQQAVRQKFISEFTFWPKTWDRGSGVTMG